MSLIEFATRAVATNAVRVGPFQARFTHPADGRVRGYTADNARLDHLVDALCDHLGKRPGAVLAAELPHHDLVLMGVEGDHPRILALIPEPGGLDARTLNTALEARARAWGTLRPETPPEGCA